MRALHEEVLRSPELTDGDLIAPLPVTSHDVIGEIAGAFNTLAQGVIDRLQRALRDARESEARFRLLTENVGDVVCLHEPNDPLAYVSPSCAALLGYAPETLLHTDPLSWLHPDDAVRLRQGALREVLAGTRDTLTYRARHKDGRDVWLETRVRAVRDETGRTVQLISSSRDISERVAAQAALERSTLYDALTGLPNRVLFHDRLAGAIEREKRRPDNGFAVLSLDFDRFKAVNDAFGHGVGDALLGAIAERLRRCVRPSDTVARLGGDEFTLLLTDLADAGEALRAAERVLRAFQTPLTVRGHTLKISASIGVTVSATGYDHPEEVLRDADIAMYQAKTQGRAGYRLFSPTMRDRVLERLALEHDLRATLAYGALEVVYQPIIAVQRGVTVGVEALVRWPHPLRGPVSPAVFVPLAEEAGLIPELDRFVLRRACAQISQLRARYPMAPPITLSVNLSSHSFAQPGFAASDLKLEITERTLMDQTETVAQVLSQLRDLGVGLHLDDFGTGYSSLSYLQHLPVSTLKIDRSFVERMTESAESAELVRTVVAMAKTLELEVVAEGIETPEQLRALQELGCDYAQGHLLSKPLPLAGLEQLLRAPLATTR